MEALTGSKYGRRWIGALIAGCVCWSLLSGIVRGQDTSDLERLLGNFGELVKAEDWPAAEREGQRLLAVAERVLADRPLKLAGYPDVMAELYSLQEKHDWAEPLWKMALELRVNNGEEPAEIAETRRSLGDCLYYEGKYREAIDAYWGVLQYHKKASGPTDLETAQSWRDIAWCYSDLKDYARAREFFANALSIRQQQLGDDNLTARSIGELADVTYYQRDYEKALELYEQAIAMRERLGDAQTESLARNWLDKGHCLNELGRLSEADKAYTKALELRREAFPSDDLHVGEWMRALASNHQEMGRYAEADELFKQALALEERAFGPFDHRVSRGLDGLAGIRFAQGRYAEAEPLYARSLKITERQDPLDELAVAAVCNNLANVYMAIDRYGDAEPLFRRALAIRERLLSPDDPTIADVLSNQGILLRYQSRGDEALPLFERALAIREKMLRPDDPDLASSYMSLARCQTDLGNLEAAEELFNKALPILEAAYGAEDSSVADCLSSVADLRYRQGKSEEAIQMYERVLAMLEADLGPEHPRLAFVLIDLANCRYDEGKFAEALEFYDRTINLDRVSPIGPYQTYFAYYKRARTHRELGNNADAVRDLERSIALAEQTRSGSSGAELERAAFFARFASAFELMVAWQVEDGNAAKALDAIERARARSLLDEIGLLGADINAGRPIEELEQASAATQQARAQLAQLEEELLKLNSSGDDSQENQAERERLQTEIAAARQQMYNQYRDSRASSQIYRNLATSADRIPSLGDLQRQLLEPDAVALVYLLGDEHGFLLTIGKNEAKIDALALDEALAARLGVEPGPLTEAAMREILLSDGGVMQMLSAPNPPEQMYERLSGLWEALLPAGLRESLAGGKVSRLHIIPSGTLSYLPFETLVVERGQKPKFLLDCGPPIDYAPSATVLDSLRIRSRRPAPRDEPLVLAVGNPQYGPDIEAAPIEAVASSRFVSLRSQLTPLPHSGIEAHWVEEIFDKAGIGSILLTQAEATESAVRQQAPRREIVHLATHGFADQTHGNLFGALALAPGQDAEQNPADDGFLTLGEIYELDLRGCELAILSACQTNYGPDQQGEGVWTLSRGFLVAGARRVLASNWVVDDEATAKLVSYFCGGLAQAKTPQRPYGESALAAKKWIRSQEKWSAPYYWGSMVLIGPP